MVRAFVASSRKVFSKLKELHMLKLYGGVRSRAGIVKWYLEEIGVPYEFVKLDMEKNEHKESWYTAIHPFGQVPAIADGDFHLWESGAILMYLADKHGKFPNSPEERAKIAQWVLFGNTTLASTLFNESMREEHGPALLQALEGVLAGKEYLVGNALSAGDVAVASILGFAMQFGGLDASRYPNIAAYVQRLTSRPAFLKSRAS